MDRKLKRLEEQQRKLMEEIERNNRRIDPDGKRNDKSGLISFLTGLILLGGGLFWVFQSIKVTSVWGSFYRLGSWAMPNGVIIIPLLAGIIMLFVMRKKIFGWVVTAIGVFIILLTVMNSVSLHFVSQSLLSYILMFGFIAVGAALVLKALFTKH